MAGKAWPFRYSRESMTRWMGWMHSMIRQRDGEPHEAQMNEYDPDWFGWLVLEPFDHPSSTHRAYGETVTLSRAILSDICGQIDEMLELSEQLRAERAAAAPSTGPAPRTSATSRASSTPAGE